MLICADAPAESVALNHAVSVDVAFPMPLTEVTVAVVNIPPRESGATEVPVIRTAPRNGFLAIPIWTICSVSGSHAETCQIDESIRALLPNLWEEIAVLCVVK